MRVTIPPFYKISDLTLDADVDFLTLYKALRLSTPAIGGALRKGNKDIGNAEIADAAAIAPSKIAGVALLQSLLNTQGDLLIRGASVAERLAKITTGQYLKATATGYEGATAGQLTVADTEVYAAAYPTAWTDLNLSATIGAQATLVVLKVQFYTADMQVFFRRNGDTDEHYNVGAAGANIALQGVASTTAYILILVHTDPSGIIEWKSTIAYSGSIDVVAYIK